MTDIYSLLPYQQQDPYKGIPDDDRIRIALYQVIVYIFVLFVSVLLCALFGSCTTPKGIEQYHHHQYQADTLAIQAQVDKRMTDTRAILDTLTRTLFSQYSASLFSNEDEKERITETVTTITDSLGRQIRTEQRTTERTLSKMQQQSEQRLSQEFDRRIRIAVDSVNAEWQQRFNALQAHLEQSDSTSVQRAFPASDALPWYKRWWQTLKNYLLLAVIIAILLMTRNIWLPWCLNLFRTIWKR